MKLKLSATPIIVVLATVLVVSVASANVTKGASGNGDDSNAPNWMLQGRSVAVKVTGNGKTATIARERICPNQTVENALPSPTLNLSGSCDDGVYMLLFQVQSTASNLNVHISRLSNFASATTNDYGVLICDSPSNTIEMCTNDPTGTHIPSYTTTRTKTGVTFTVPGTFPTYPAGTKEQGQGLTFFVITNSNQAGPPLPLDVVNIAIN